MTYAEYMTTSWWSDLAAERKRMAQYRCECCGREDRRLDCHHLRYRDEDGLSILGREAMQDLEVLCRPCHLGTELVTLLKAQTPEAFESPPSAWWPEGEAA